MPATRERVPATSDRSDIVRGMRSLANLLEGAVRRGAFEVRLESRQPVVYTTARGSEAEASVLPSPELFDMIVAAVDDAQQIELAVGNHVEFELDAGARWSVSAEPGQEGITVLAKRPGRAAAPSFHEEDVSLGFELDEPEFGIAAAPAPKRPRPPSAAPPSQLYVEALDVPMVDSGVEVGPEDSISADFAGVLAGSAAPFESGTWTLDDDEELDVGFDEPDEDSLPTGFAKVGPADPHIGVPADDDEADAQFGVFADSGPPPPPDPVVERRHTLSPTVKAMEASTPSKPAGHRTDADISQRITQRELGAMRGEGATQRELASFHVGSGLIADVSEGTLVYVLEPGFADVLARSSQAPAITIDDPHDPVEVWTHVRELPVGAIVIVRCEDPSVLLDGILRRLEEGYRVFVETRARTVEGARRMLLGITATDRAERWLDAQRTLMVEPGEGGPQLVPYGKG
jgi:hypothetical protein